jgi:trk system potassium uptake protein TrkH
MILWALPFAFHYRVFSREGLLKRSATNLEVAVFFIIITVGVIMFYWIASSQVDIYSSIFHIISASTTTGFQYLDIQSIPYAARIFLILIMLVGGTAFSTAGGIKVGRFIVLYQEFRKKRRPLDSGISPVFETSTSTSISSTANPYRSSEFLTKMQEEYRRRNLESMFEEQQTRIIRRVSLLFSKKVVREILFVIVLYILIALITGSILTYTTKNSFENALFEATSAISTTGLTAGVTSLDLDSFSKLVLTTNMIIGRFEIITILYIFFIYFRK